MTENTTTPVVISTPVDLVAAVPAVLGFTPEKSLVVLGFTGTRLGMGARVDLPRTPADAEAAAAALAQGIGAATPVAVVLVGAVGHTVIVDALRGVFAEVRSVHTVADYLLGRTVRDETGTPVGALPDHRGTDVGLAHAVTGRPAAPSRDTLVAEMAEVQARPEAQSVADTLTDPTARDRALFVAVAGRAARARWTRIATESRGEGRARVAALLAAAWYATGDGPRARIAADVAQDIDPANTLAALVGTGLDNGVPPARLPGGHRHRREAVLTASRRPGAHQPRGRGYPTPTPVRAAVGFLLEPGRGGGASRSTWRRPMTGAGTYDLHATRRAAHQLRDEITGDADTRPRHHA